MQIDHLRKFTLLKTLTILFTSLFIFPGGPAFANQETKMILTQPLGYPVYRDAEPINHIIVKRTTINSNKRITIHPLNRPDTPWLEFAEDKNVNKLVESKNTFYTLISGSYMTLHPTQPGQAMTVQQNTLLTRLAEGEDGTFMIYMGDPSHVDESKAPRYMKVAYPTTFALQESDIPNYETTSIDMIMEDPKKQEAVLKAHFDKVNGQQLADVKIPSKGKLHQGSVADQSIKLAKRIAEQDGQKAGKAHVVSDGWLFKKHAITGIPLYRYANVAFTQKNKNGKCMLLGFQIRQDFDGGSYNDMVYSKTMLRNPPYGQYMSCKNL